MRAIGVNAVSVSSIEEGRNYEMVSKNADDQGYAVDAASAKVSPDIEWSGLTMTAQQRSKKILNDCWGSVKSGTICGLLGASGAGKSSLLNILSGRQTAGGGVDIEGKITVGGKVINPVAFRKNIAYVMQDDALLPTATPREALRLSATLRLPQTTSIAEIHRRVEALIDELGITECADVTIGGALIKGISGGQRKRTSIGIELITNPVLLFLDEPTSGLDSHTSCSLLALLKQMALKDCTILCTLHQPSSEIFFMFDSVIFMKAGRIFYQGPVNAVVKHFAHRGFECPENYNPADYVMTVLQMTSEEECAEKKLFMPCPVELLEKGGSVKWSAQEIQFTAVASFARQFSTLTTRATQHTLRDIPTLIFRFGGAVYLHLLFGLIFLNAGKGDNANSDDVEAHFGAIMMILIVAMFGAAQPVALTFPIERPMFLREYSSNTYGGLAYFLSKLTVEAPLVFLQNLVSFILVYFMVGMTGNFIFIVLAAWGLSMASGSVAVMLGCLVPDVKQIAELVPLMFIPQMLFVGLFIPTQEIPEYLRWAQYLCSLKYSMNLVLLTEFQEDHHSCSKSPQALASCKQLIDANNIDRSQYWIYIILLFALFFAFRMIGAVVLIRKAKKYY